MNRTDFYIRLQALPDGANDVDYLGRRYLLRKETLLDGRLIKLYAEELGGKDIVSGNYYPTIKEGTLKPCEMSDAKVIDFVLRALPIDPAL
jgi:peptide-methionine (S)-S-oxide reductase